jgi:hypothetical protein
MNYTLKYLVFVIIQYCTHHDKVHQSHLTGIFWIESLNIGQVHLLAGEQKKNSFRGLYV